MSMKVETPNPDTIVYHVSGSFDALAVKEHRLEMEALLDDAPSLHVFDFSGTNFMDSSGIGAVVFMYKQLKTRQKRVAITGLIGQPLDLIEMLRVGKVIDIYPTISDVPSD